MRTEQEIENKSHRERERKREFAKHFKVYDDYHVIVVDKAGESCL